jgi:hypothetical protein
MMITLTPDIEHAVIEQAHRRGTTPESLIVEALREKFVLSQRAPRVPPQPSYDWERMLLSAASDCGISLPHEAVSSEGLYD